MLKLKVNYEELKKVINKVSVIVYNPKVSDDERLIQIELKGGECRVSSVFCGSEYIMTRVKMLVKSQEGEGLLCVRVKELKKILDSYSGSEVEKEIEIEDKETYIRMEVLERGCRVIRCTYKLQKGKVLSIVKKRLEEEEEEVREELKTEELKRVLNILTPIVQKEKRVLYKKMYFGEGKVYVVTGTYLTRIKVTEVGVEDIVLLPHSCMCLKKYIEGKERVGLRKEKKGENITKLILESEGERLEIESMSIKRERSIEKEEKEIEESEISYRLRVKDIKDSLKRLDITKEDMVKILDRGDLLKIKNEFLEQEIPVLRLVDRNKGCNYVINKEVLRGVFLADTKEKLSEEVGVSIEEKEEELCTLVLNYGEIGVLCRGLMRVKG